MSIEAIEESLAIAEHCISTRKPNGGLYGYPAVLLLFCIIDALSNYLGHTKNTLRGLQFIFPALSELQIGSLKNWYRNLLAHQAMIMPGTQLSDEPDGMPIEFNSDGEPTHIRVLPLHRAVKRWWEAFDKGRINPKFEPNQAPKTSIPTSTSPPTTSSPLPGTSGYYVTSTLRKP
jgi:hypothetical protein